MTILRIIILFSFLHFLNLTSLEIIHREGDTLSRLYNLPHRSLGMLYYCAVKAPYRADYVKDYLVAYFNAADGGYLQEGQKYPVVDCYAVNAARSFPKNQDLWAIRCMVMENHNRWCLEKERENKK